MAHPIRPESYISMDNFYTATVYEKGAEVIRMIETLVSRDGFRRGMDLYFERHDGAAVTCDDFRAAMADANDVDLGLFERWYAQPGTPVITAEGEYDERSNTYMLTLRQSAPEQRGAAADAPDWQPMHVPVRVGLLGADGTDLPLRFVGEDAGRARPERVLELVEAERRFTFEDVPERPVPSLLRGFSAPVKLVCARSRDELAFLMAHDSDAFNRWEAGQELAKDLLLALTADAEGGRALALDADFSDAFARILTDPQLDGSLKAQALTLPGERVLGQDLDEIPVDALHRARQFMRQSLAEAHEGALGDVYAACESDGAYAIDQPSIGRRRLRNVALAYLSSIPGDAASERLARQFESADNMTDTQAALSMLADCDGPAREDALAAFYERWKSDPLVLDKWFSVQAMSKREDTAAKVVALAEHPDFSLRNPNRVRSLVGIFCAGNQVRFHGADGVGYRFLTEMVIALDGNPQVAARMASSFNNWRRFDAGRRALMKAELERIARQKPLSNDVFEIVSRALD
jgi:aminopeptidase N